MAQNGHEMAIKWPQNCLNDLNGFNVTSETISIVILPPLWSFWVVTWLVCDNFEFLATNWPGMVPKWPQNDPEIAQNYLNVFKVTLENISIRILLLLWLFWVVTWLVCDNFDLGAQIAPKWSQNGPKMTLKLPKMTSMGSKWLPKPSPSNFCPSCDRFEWSHD